MIWNRGPLRGLSREAYIIGAVDFDLKTEVGINGRHHVPALEDFPADLILAADFLFHKEYSIFIEDGSVSI